MALRKHRKIELPHDIEGRCFSCGYLGAHHLPESEGGAGAMLLYEVTWEAREIAGLWHAGTHQGIHTKPLCARLVSEFMEQIEVIRKIDDGFERQEETGRIIERKRDCEKWCQYTPHFSPKEHLQEARMLEIERLRREQAEMIAGVQQHIHNEQLKMDVEHAKTAQLQSDILRRMEAHEVKSGEDTTKFNRWFLALALVALVLALGQIIVPNGLPLISHRPTERIEITLDWPTDVSGLAAFALPTLTPTPSPESIPGTASPQPQSTP